MRIIQENEEAIDFHIRLDIKHEKEYPNETWPEFLINYYNKKKGGDKNVTKEFKEGQELFEL